VEIIEVAPISSAAASAIDDQRDRLFVASHWFAYDTGEQLTVRTQPGDADQVLRVATPSGLFATKAHALVGRPSEDAQGVSWKTVPNGQPRAKTLRMPCRP
jgi:hypothetical protein